MSVKQESSSGMYTRTMQNILYSTFDVKSAQQNVCFRRNLADRPPLQYEKRPPNARHLTQSRDEVDLNKMISLTTTLQRPHHLPIPKLSSSLLNSLYLTQLGLSCTSYISTIHVDPVSAVPFHPPTATFLVRTTLSPSTNDPVFTNDEIDQVLHRLRHLPILPPTTIPVMIAPRTQNRPQ